VYASLANGTLVVFTPKTVSTARRCSHNDVTLVTKEEDEQVTRESDTWSNLQVCHLFFIVKNPIPQMAGHENFNPTVSSLSKDPLHKWRPNLNDNTSYILSLVLMFPDKGFFTWMRGLGCSSIVTVQISPPFMQRVYCRL